MSQWCIRRRRLFIDVHEGIDSTQCNALPLGVHATGGLQVF